MATVNLINSQESIITGKDSLVFRKVIYDIPGGKSLNVTGITAAVIESGHIIIKETATGDYKPLTVTANAYDALPTGHTYAGLLIGSILTAKPFAAIAVAAQVNDAVVPYPIPEAFKTAFGSAFDYCQD